ncbi:hypothetical protein F7725_010827 [Dissostichus mawsoni]|uniref:Uncharacterized protein n=1 Tax=Dissostichus mawsoni TaxID=36200 RepID=A0A7J5Z7J2_DISMA|nr:hypothetical protein F7725_010827 [Dissostichus mawsoni]
MLTCVLIGRSSRRSQCSEALLRTRGVISFTFKMIQRRCIVRIIQSELRAEVLVPLEEEGSGSDQDQELPDYLPEDESPSVDPEQALTQGRSERGGTAGWEPPPTSCPAPSTGDAAPPLRTTLLPNESEPVLLAARRRDHGPSDAHREVWTDRKSRIRARLFFESIRASLAVRSTESAVVWCLKDNTQESLDLLHLGAVRPLLLFDVVRCVGHFWISCSSSS